jgi:thiosulfate dehydrogenase (quinone) large subunit
LLSYLGGFGILLVFYFSAPFWNFDLCSHALFAWYWQLYFKTQLPYESRQAMRIPDQGVKANSRGLLILFLIIRLLMGGMMLEEGLHKLVGGIFSASGFLANSTGPFSGCYVSLVPYSPALSVFVIWSQILIGMALLAGVLVRLVSFFAAVMMLIFYLAYIPSPLGWLNYQIIYTALFVANMFSGAGYFFGFDRLLYKLEDSKHPLRLIFG